MNKYYFILCAALLFALSSCSSLRIEKRHYRDGFYISYNKSDKGDVVAPSATEEPNKADAAIDQQDVNNAEEPAVVTDNNTSPPAKEDVEIITQPEAKETEKTTGPSETSRPEDEQQNSPAAENTATPAHDSDVMLILEVILAILLPPLAVYLHEGATKWFWIDLILFLFVVLWFTPFHYGGAIWLASVVIALLVVFDLI